MCSFMTAEGSTANTSEYNMKMDCHSASKKKKKGESAHTTEKTGNATITLKWMTRQHRVNVIRKLQR